MCLILNDIICWALYFIRLFLIYFILVLQKIIIFLKFVSNIKTIENFGNHISRWSTKLWPQWLSSSKIFKFHFFSFGLFVMLIFLLKIIRRRLHFFHKFRLSIVKKFAISMNFFICSLQLSFEVCGFLLRCSQKLVWLLFQRL